MSPPGTATGRSVTSSTSKNRPVNGGRLSRPQRAHDVDGLVGAGPALGHRNADGVELVRELSPDPDPERDPTARPRVEVGDLLGHDHRVVQRKQQDRRADPDPFGPRRHQSQSGDRLAGAGPRQEMTALPDRLDREAFDRGQPRSIRFRERGGPEHDALS